MASAAPRRSPNDADRREVRLAELVAALTGCDAPGALHAVREHAGQVDALGIVARAMVEVDGPPPERFRIAGFLREGALVHHGSLRRWDRLHHEPDRPEDRIVARFEHTPRWIDLTRDERRPVASMMPDAVRSGASPS
jgi:hypothetical protein